MESLAAGLVLLSLAAVSMAYKARAALRSQGKSPIWIQSVLPACIVVGILLKSGLALSLMSSDLTPGPVAWIWTVFLLGSAASLTFLFSQRVGDFACWCLVFVFSLLFWGDVLYYRQFQDFLMLNHFVYLWSPDHQGPMEAANLQLKSLVEPIDYLLLFDLPILLFVLWLAPPVDSAGRRRLRMLPAVLVPLFLSGNLLWYLRADAWTKHFYADRLYNRSHVSENGLPAYHLYDLYHWLRPRLTDPKPVPDEVIRKRLQVSNQTIGPEYTGFGCAANANVIVIQLESFQYFVIGMEVGGQEVTPFLNSLRAECLYGDALDQTASGSTSDAMFCMLNSLQPPSGGPFCFLFPTNSTRALPRILSERGWSTLHVMSYDGAFWNTRQMGDGFGFQEQYFTSDLPAPARGEAVGWGLSDAALFERVIDLLRDRPKPFLCYITTTMMHYPFQELHTYQKSLQLPPDLTSTMAGRYLQLAHFRDQAIELFVHRLKEDGLWDNTILILCGDHRSRMPDIEFERLGIPQAEPLRNRLPLFVHAPKKAVQGDLAGLPGQMDVAPTVLHLLGIQDAGQVFLGRNLLAGRHASASPYGYISDGEVGLWRGANNSEDRLLRLADGEKLPLTVLKNAVLREQLDEEVQISDTLLYGNRVTEFSR